MKQTLFLLLAVSLNATIGWSAVPGGQSLQCQAPTSDTVSIYVDVWMTGHPMGGIGSFEGVMQVDGHTFLMHTSIQPAAFYGSTNDLSRIDYKLALGGLMNGKPGEKIHTTLMSREQALGPQPAGPWTSFDVICAWEEP